MKETAVLVVDDDEILRLDLRDLLQRLGYQVVGEASDARRAITLARRLRPDLVIMDAHLSGEIDGIEATAVLTSEQLTPVLLLTDLSDVNLVRRAVDAGATGYLRKPVDEESLHPAIEVALSRFRQIRSLEKKVSTLIEELEASRIVEQAKAMLMKEYKLTEEEAFARIRQVSNSSHQTVRAVAEAIILARHLDT